MVSNNMVRSNAITLGTLAVVIVIVIAQLAFVTSKLGSIENSLNEQSKRIDQVNANVENVGGKVKAIEEKTGELNTTLQEKLSNIEASINSLRESNKLLSTRLNDTSKELESIKETVENLASTVETLTGYPRSVTDFSGEAVVIPYEPKRVVSLAPSVTEIIFALGAEDKLVGVDDYSNYPPQLNDMVSKGLIERVGGFTTPNYEEILKLNPDVVFTVSGVQEPVAHKLRSLGVRVVVLGSSNMNDVVSSVILVGKVLGVDTDALKVAEEITGTLQSLARVSSQFNTTPRVAIIVWNNPIFVAGASSYLSSLIELAGGINAFVNYTKSYPMIGPEDLATVNPDVILFTEGSGVSNYTDAVSWLRSLPGCSGLKALSTGEIYVLHGDYSDTFVRPGVRTPAAGLVLLAILHGQEIGINVPHDITPETLPFSQLVSVVSENYNVTITFPLPPV